MTHDPLIHFHLCLGPPAEHCMLIMLIRIQELWIWIVIRIANKIQSIGLWAGQDSAPHLQKIVEIRSKLVEIGLHCKMLAYVIGGDSIEARRHVPPHFLEPEARNGVCLPIFRTESIWTAVNKTIKQFY